MKLLLLLGEFYLPLWISILFIMIGIWRVIRYIRVHFEGQENDFIKRLRWYPAVLIICWVFPTFQRIYSAINNRSIYWMLLFHVSLVGLQGFLNFLVYGFTESVRMVLRENCCQCFQPDPPRNVRTSEQSSDAMTDVNLGEYASEFFYTSRNQSVNPSNSTPVVSHKPTIELPINSL